MSALLAFLSSYKKEMSLGWFACKMLVLSCLSSFLVVLSRDHLWDNIVIPSSGNILEGGIAEVLLVHGLKRIQTEHNPDALILLC